MLTKNDLILLLTELESQGVDTTKQISMLIRSDKIPVAVLRYINDQRQFDVAAFYETLRRSYNQKKSPLYKNLVKEEFEDPSDILTTLSALNLQIMLFARKLPDNKMFLKHSRGEEITEVLNNYYKTYDLIPCLKALRVIKADLKSFEHITRGE